jgi:Bacterial Ig-like domain (group 1)
LQPNAIPANRFATLASPILAFIAAAILAGCGGGGGQPVSATGTTTTTTTTTAVAQSIQLLAGATTLPSVGGSSATVGLTAIVLDTNNNALANQAVTFAVIDPVSQPAFVNGVSGSGQTDANGLVTATLNLGANKTNRNITVNANVIPGSGQAPITATVNVAVVGTVITISGGNALVFGATLSSLTATLKDSAGNPIPGQAVTIKSSAGNTVTPATATTDVNGSVTFNVTGTVGGADVITVAGAGAAGTLNISVNSANFIFQSPAANALVVINTPQVITVHWDNAGVPQVGQPVLFSSTRGTLSAATVNTDVNGNASTSITSPGSGQSTITAVGPGGIPAASLNIVFVTTSANKVSVQAAQASIPVNIVGQTTNQTQLVAIVRDVNDNLVQGATVNFQIVTDPSGGQLSSPSAITDISGSATVNYIAGSTSSGNNTVIISATVVSVNGVPVTTPVSATVNLTVSGQSLFIRMQTDNIILPGAGFYTKSYYALVTDAAGNPVGSTTVVFSLEPANCIGSVTCGDTVIGGSLTQCEQLGNAACPGAYEKGQWVFCGAVGSPFPLCPNIGWYKIAGALGITYYNCLNEDVNFNGILDPGEDYNGNHKLDPGNVAGVNNTGTTDPTTGIATANVTYVKGFASWSAVNLTATITVTGTEFIQSIQFILPISASDLASITPPPPGQVSPFGQGVCTSPQ